MSFQICPVRYSLLFTRFLSCLDNAFAGFSESLRPFALRTSPIMILQWVRNNRFLSNVWLWSTDIVTLTRIGDVCRPNGPLVLHSLPLNHTYFEWVYLDLIVALCNGVIATVLAPPIRVPFFFLPLHICAVCICVFITSAMCACCNTLLVCVKTLNNQQ